MQKKILVTGVESSGTRMVAAMLRKAGADVTQSSPNHRREQGKFPHKMNDFKAAVLVVRNSWPHTHSMVDAGHALNREHARQLTLYGLKDILHGLSYGSPTRLFVATYEALVHEPEALPTLIKELGLSLEEPQEPIGDANAKWYGSKQWFRDDRALEERS